MSAPTEVFSGTDVDYVRILLGQAGRLNHIVEKNEPQMAISSQKIYTNFKDLSDVVGIWSGSDVTHSGTNLALGGTFYSKEGLILTSGSNLTAGQTYLVSYVHQDGLTDREVERCLADAEVNVQLFLYQTDDINYDITTTKGKMTTALKYNLASLHALSILNTGNIIQSGFNYALGEVRIETKLWGEGMSAETLIQRIEMKINGILDMLKLYYSDTHLIQVLDRGLGEVRYDRGRAQRLIRRGSLYDWVMDGITISRSFRIIEPDWSV